MATQTVEFRSPPSQTVTAKLFAVGSDTEVASVSSTEATNRKGTYSAAYTDVTAGEYELIALVGAVPVARWFVTLTLTTATFQAYDKVRAGLDSATITAIQNGVVLANSAHGGSGATLTLGAVTITVTGSTPNITLAGSGSGNGIEWTRSGSGDPLDQDIVDQIQDGIGGGGGLTGPYTRTVTVTDADTSDPIQGATVRLYRIGETGSVATNVSGIASFTVEAATWSYAITASGYTGVSGTIVVSANGNTDVELTISSPDAPDDPALCLVTIPIYDQFGQPLVDEPVDILFVKFASNATATPPVLSPPPPQTSDENGQVIVELWRLAKYRIEYGQAEYRRRVDIDVPNSGTFVVE